MLYEFRQGINVASALKNIHEVYQDQAPAKRTVGKWFAKFSRGEFNLEDDPRSGRPSPIDDDIVRILVLNTPQISTEKVASALNVDRSTAFWRLKNMGFDLKLDIWVPHLLTERNQIERISAAVSLLGRLKIDLFFNQLVMGYEKWVLYNNVQRKRKWKLAGEHGDAMAKGQFAPNEGDALCLVGLQGHNLF